MVFFFLALRSSTQAIHLFFPCHARMTLLEQQRHSLSLTWILVLGFLYLACGADLDAFLLLEWGTWKGLIVDEGQQ